MHKEEKRMHNFVSKMLAGSALAALAAGLVLPGVGRAKTAELIQLDPAQALIRCDANVERLTLQCLQFDQQQVGNCLNNANNTNQANACDKTGENELTEINLTEGIRVLTCKANTSYVPNPTDCGFGITLQSVKD